MRPPGGLRICKDELSAYSRTRHGTANRRSQNLVIYVEQVPFWACPSGHSPREFGCSDDSGKELLVTRWHLTGQIDATLALKTAQHSEFAILR
eukprot:7426973-Pyramimonas_sp.AAC.1